MRLDAQRMHLRDLSFSRGKRFEGAVFVTVDDFVDDGFGSNSVADIRRRYTRAGIKTSFLREVERLMLERKRQFFRSRNQTPDFIRPSVRSKLWYKCWTCRIAICLALRVIFTC
jgi:hypothetical protein